MRNPIARLLRFVVLLLSVSRFSGAASGDANVAPWQREQPLKEAARTAVIASVLDPVCPAVVGGANARGLTLNNAQLRSSLWGPAERVTLSLLKTDVWDRRYGTAPTVTLADIRAGVFSPANRGFDDMPEGKRRPVRGYLLPEGGRIDPFACWNAYPFPCEKPVGQIILGLDELTGAPETPLAQSCADGVVRFQLKNERAQADLQILLSMTRNVYAIRGRLTGVTSPTLRLYRHVDQAHRRYMTPDGTAFLPQSPGAASGGSAAAKVDFDYAKDAAWNGPVAPPESGTDGRYFWIRQRMPAEKTFPQGFEYVLMGVTMGGDKTPISTVNGKAGLGTPPRSARGEAAQRLEDGYKAIREAPGSAATATLAPDSDGNFFTCVTVVTSNDSADPLAEARRQLDAAVAVGFEKLVAENVAWFTRFYEQREDGRVFFGSAGTEATERVQDIFSSWHTKHGGWNKPDARRYEASASYANVEQDWQLWHSLPCYNELFYTPAFVRHRADSVSQWWQLVEAWLPAARENAREVYGVPGMALVHGYQPPVKPDHYVHTSVALEYCIDTIGQLVKVLWDEWDYGGDPEFLRQKVYPALRDAAVFYAAYAQKGADGREHFIPSIEAEAWGIFPEFARAKDTISALCMARWTWLCAAEAAEQLNVDAGPRAQWRELAGRLAPYPTYEAKNGMIFNSVAGTVPGWKPGDHPWYAGFYPTSLADEITLDSGEAMRAQMLRTVEAIPSARGREVLALLAANTPAPSRDEVNQNPERLLNSRGGRIHLFPGVAADAAVAFRHFQARGGFLVSAAQDARGVAFVEIEARRDAECRLMQPWPGRAVAIREAKSGRSVSFVEDRTNGDCLVFAAKAGERYQVVRADGPVRSGN